MGNQGNLSEEKRKAVALDGPAEGLQERVDITTPGPWTVEPHPDAEGAFTIKEARKEEVDWVGAGYDISDDEGMRRDEIMEEHKWGNARTIEQAPHMLACLLEVAACLRDNKPFRPELVKEIDRSLARITGRPEPKHIPQWIQVLKEKTHQEASKNELVIVMDGGLIQEILSSTDPTDLPRVVVVDYDTEGSNNEPVRLENGDKALVWDAVVDRNDKFCRGVCEIIDKLNAEEDGKMKNKQYTVNERGLAEIKEFLDANHLREYFNPAELRAWASDAEFQAAEGNSPSIEVGAADSMTGCTVTYTISDEGMDCKEVEIDSAGNESSPTAPAKKAIPKAPSPGM